MTSYFQVDELYLRNSIYVTEYDLLVKKVRAATDRNHPITFAFSLEQRRSNEQSFGDMRRPKEDQNVSPQQFWWNRHQLKMNQFREEMISRSLTCFVEIHGKPILFEQRLSTFHLPDGVMEYIEQRSLVGMNERLNADCYKPNHSLHRSYLQRIKQYRLMRAQGHSAVMRTPDLNHDEYGLARCDVANVLVRTRDPARFYIGVTKVFEPYQTNELPVRLLDSFDYAYRVFEDRKRPMCLNYNVGGRVRIDDLPLPYDKYPAEGRTVDYHRVRFYRLTKSEVKALLEDNLFF